MTKRRKIVIGVCAGLIIVPLFLLFAVLGLFYYTLPDFNGQEHLPDEVLIQNFHRHRAEFELLRSMLEHDSDIHRIDDNWTDPENIPGAKVTEYRKLFGVIGTPRGFYNRRNPLRIELIASAQGMVTSGSMKGYLYKEEKPEELSDSLDKLHDGTYPSREMGWRHIEGNWYLYFER